MLPSERHIPYYVPESDITHRISKFQSALRDAEIALAYISHPTDLTYFSGSIQNSILLIPSKGEPVHFVKRSLKRAEVESSLTVIPYPGRKGILNKIIEFLGMNPRLGMAMDVTPASTIPWLTEKLSGIDIINIKNIVLLQKAVKSAWEIEQMEKAAQQADLLFQEIPAIIRPDISEIEMSAEIEKRLRVWGHSGTIRVRNPGASLGILSAASGDAALYPTHFDGPVGGEGPYPYAPAGAGWKKIVPGETVIIDVVTAYNGYHSDNSRSFFIGKDVPETVKKAHDYCLDVLALLEEKLRPGYTCDQIYNDVQAWTEQNKPPEGFMGYGDNRVKFFGHGIGLELDEFPIIAAKIDMELKMNMTLAVEPKAFLPGIGPVGVENTYVITEQGCNRLCTAEQGIVPIH
jgi:Xaa-Pro dipeptidase